MKLAGPMTRLLTRRTLRTVIGLLVLVEAIFLAESFTSILEEAVRNSGTVFDVAKLLLLTAPEVIDFALPLALMLGLFFAITAARDDNELVICAAAGVPWTRVPIFAGIIGLIGLCFSLLFAGLLTPLSSYVLRLSMVELQARSVIQEITLPGQRNTLRTIEGRTIIATPSPDAASKRGNLFIYHPEPGDGWRVSRANDWTVVGPDDEGGYAVQMRQFRESTGAASGGVVEYEDTPDDIRNLFPSGKINVSTVTMDFRLDDLIRKADTARRGKEVLVLAQAGTLLTDSTDINLSRRLGEILARALLCPIAALLAVAAASFAVSKVGRLLALPVGTVLVLAGDIVARALLGDAAALGGGFFWATLAAISMVGLGAPLAYILRHGEILIAPARGRA